MFTQQLFETNKVYNGDAVEVLRSFPDECIDMVFTSPPYGTVRNYNGYKFNFQEIADELTRTLKHGGVIVWNEGDTIVKGSKTLIPYEHALYFSRECGLKVHDTMIYEKNSCSYPAKRNGLRYSNVFEYVFIISKGKPNTVNLICDKRNRCYGEKGFGKSSQRLKDGDLIKYERKPTPEFSPRDNIWRYFTGKGYSSKDSNASKHPAIMPELLAFDIIRTFTNESDIVLDPMAGSGTSCVMANVLKRKYIGIEISDEYCQLINKRFQYPYDVEELKRKSSEQYNSRFREKDRKIDELKEGGK
jgi:DNA modification methylase